MEIKSAPKSCDAMLQNISDLSYHLGRMNLHHDAVKHQCPVTMVPARFHDSANASRHAAKRVKNQMRPEILQVEAQLVPQRSIFETFRQQKIKPDERNE
jgi:hypothetical protein